MAHAPETPMAFAQPQRPRSSSIRQFATLRTVVALMLREMSTRYGRTPGGYVWAVAEPTAAILLLAIGFSLVVHTPSLGTSFLLFYATGYLPFGLYNRLSNTISSAIPFSAALLRYPAVTWVDAIFARFFLNSLTEITVGAILIIGIISVVDAHTQISSGPMLTAIGLTMLMGLGIGTLNSVLTGLFPLWHMIWSVLNRPLFLASGIFFLYEEMPPMAQDILWYNPILHITGIFRSGIYPTYTAAYASPIYVLIIALTLLFFGVLLMGRYHREILIRF